MDRTIIAPYRAEEKELSQILYENLQGLALLHPPTEDMKKCLSEEMFVKPNQQAFFHVMHYLFRLIDPNEFKKRFYWPITDKRSESNFRTSTVEYLKYLNEKHQLNWPNIKSYLVVMPGGMKFISFMLDFVHFIIQELIKQKEKQLNVDSSQLQGTVTEENLQKICKKDALFKEMASGFLNSIDVVNKRCTEKVQMLTQLLEELAIETGIHVDLLTDDKFLKDFEDSNMELFEKHFALRTKQILAVEGHIAALKESMDRFYSKESGFKYDAQKIRQQLRTIRDHFSMENLTEASIVSDDGVNINTLIKTYNCIHETIQSELSSANKMPTARIVKSRLLDLQKDLQLIENQITDFLMVIKSRRKKRQDNMTLHTPKRSGLTHTVCNIGIGKLNFENGLLNKYVSTPPIKLEMQEGQHGPSRLSLIDNKNTANTSTFNSFLAPPRTVRQTRLNSSLVDQTLVDLNSTVNRSKLIDPMQLLRSINKDNSKVITTPKTSLSSLGSKWKERQSLFMDKDDEIPGTPTVVVTGVDSPSTHTKAYCSTKEESSTYVRRQSLFSDKEPDVSNSSSIAKKSFATSSGSPTIIQSPYTPFNSNERTRIARPQSTLWDTNSFTACNNSVSTSWSGIKKMSAVKKVQDASKMFINLSTSPSGRLEPLVTADEFNIPKLKLNDLSLIDHNMSLNNSVTCEGNSTDLSRQLPIDNDENDVNAGNRNKHESLINCEENLQQEEEDALFNISDSVLKDITL